MATLTLCSVAWNHLPGAETDRLTVVTLEGERNGNLSCSVQPRRHGKVGVLTSSKPGLLRLSSWCLQQAASRSGPAYLTGLTKSSLGVNGGFISVWEEEAEPEKTVTHLNVLQLTIAANFCPFRKMCSFWWIILKKKPIIFLKIWVICHPYQKLFYYPFVFLL